MSLLATPNESSDDICKICQHEFNPHVLLALSNPNAPDREQEKLQAFMQGGIILCPVPECRCFATWGFNGMDADKIAIPNMEIIESIRREMWYA